VLGAEDQRTSTHQAILEGILESFANDRTYKTVARGR
jgi:hypothetical protein